MHAQLAGERQRKLRKHLKSEIFHAILVSNFVVLWALSLWYCSQGDEQEADTRKAGPERPE